MCKRIRDIYNKTPEQLLKEAKQTNAVPVDLEAVLQTCGISALPYDFSEYEKETGRSVLGALATSGDEAAIFFNEKNPTMTQKRKRFTIAHELAHACLSGHQFHVEFRIDEKIDDGDFYDDPDSEKEANIFAGALLIPQKTLQKKLDELLIPTLTVLANQFNVSRGVMWARLKHLGLGECVIT